MLNWGIFINPRAGPQGLSQPRPPGARPQRFHTGPRVAGFVSRRHLALPDLLQPLLHPLHHIWELLAQVDAFGGVSGDIVQRQRDVFPFRRRALKSAVVGVHFRWLQPAAVGGVHQQLHVTHAERHAFVPRCAWLVYLELTGCKVGNRWVCC